MQFLYWNINVCSSYSLAMYSLTEIALLSVKVISDQYDVCFVAFTLTIFYTIVYKSLLMQFQWNSNTGYSDISSRHIIGAQTHTDTHTQTCIMSITTWNYIHLPQFISLVRSNLFCAVCICAQARAVCRDLRDAGAERHWPQACRPERLSLDATLRSPPPLSA